MTGKEPWSADDEWPPGWYADPWQAGRERRWTGTTWTAETRGASGPSIFALGGGAPPAPPAPPADVPTLDVPPEMPWWQRPRYLAFFAGITVIALILGFTITYAATDSSKPNRVATPPTFAPRIPRTSPSPTPPSFSGPNTSPPTTGGQPANDPNANVLQQLVVRNADVTNPDYTLVTGGDTTDDPTLDLCNGTYPSEALRTARLQINVYDVTGSPAFSTEAVLYKNAAATAQAFAELRAIVAQCPQTPVASPVGEPTVTTTFNAVPDTTWPRTPGVERVAFDLTTTSTSGQSAHSFAVYLRRGRALLGVYLNAPTEQLTIAGKTGMPAIVREFEHRLASVPAQSIGA